MTTLTISILLAIAVAGAAAGVRLRRPTLAIAGFAVAAFVAFGQLSGRFGLEQIWFRTPTFYVAALTVLAGIVWWLRRPLPLAVKAVPVAGVILAGAAALAFMLFNGRGAPAAMLVPTLNRAAPDITYVDAAGASRRLSDLKGDVVLINFWATWCAPCRREMPLLAKMQRAYEPQRFRVLYLSLEEPQVLDAFLRANHFDGIQGRIAAAPPFYDAGKYYPLSYLVSRDGAVVARWSGRPGEAWLSDTIERQL
jgi:cytochrome c biogenesis protein CcmG, thiol:disulfide interchange protein DsbE